MGTTLDGLTEAQLYVALDTLAEERRRETDPERRAALVIEADAVLDALAELGRTHDGGRVT